MRDRTGSLQAYHAGRPVRVTMRAAGRAHAYTPRMELLDSPMMMVLSLVMGTVSFVLVTAGLRSSNLAMALWGVAIGAPSYGPQEPVFWAMGAVIGFFAWRLGQS